MNKYLKIIGIILGLIILIGISFIYGFSFAINNTYCVDWEVSEDRLQIMEDEFKGIIGNLVWIYEEDEMQERILEFCEPVFNGTYTKEYGNIYTNCMGLRKCVEWTV